MIQVSDQGTIFYLKMTMTVIIFRKENYRRWKKPITLVIISNFNLSCNKNSGELEEICSKPNEVMNVKKPFNEIRMSIGVCEGVFVKKN